MTESPAQGTRAAAPGRPGAAWVGGAAVLAIATTVGNALSYAYSLVMSRALGPADYGALGALIGIAVIASVPAIALQTQVARVTAQHPGSVRHREQGYRWGWVIGLVLAGSLVVLAVPIASALRLDSAVNVVLLGVGVVPVSAIAARQGVLLGREAMGRLGAAFVVVPALRLVGGGVAAATGSGVSGALGLQAAATWVGWLAVCALVPAPPEPDGPTGSPGRGLEPRALMAAAVGLLGLFALANVDLLLARAYLGEVESGLYAVGTIGVKVVFWGTQFVALLIFPRVARGAQGATLVARAGALVLLVGLAGAAAAVPLAGPLIDLLVGPAYAPVAPLAPWFVVLGTMLALVQLSTYATVAADQRRYGSIIWLGLVAEVALVGLAFHEGLGQILAVAITTSAVLAMVGLLPTRAARR